MHPIFLLPQDVRAMIVLRALKRWLDQKPGRAEKAVILQNWADMSGVEASEVVVVHASGISRSERRAMDSLKTMVEDEYTKFLPEWESKSRRATDLPSRGDRNVDG